jgi:hypothetical protein
MLLPHRTDWSDRSTTEPSISVVVETEALFQADTTKAAPDPRVFAPEPSNRPESSSSHRNPRLLDLIFLDRKIAKESLPATMDERLLELLRGGAARIS